MNEKEKLELYPKHLQNNPAFLSLRIPRNSRFLKDVFKPTLYLPYCSIAVVALCHSYNQLFGYPLCRLNVLKIIFNFNAKVASCTQ